MRERYASMSGWIVPAFECEEPVKLRCVDTDPRHLSLLELEPGDCRYPYGGDEEGEAITFCGQPCAADSSYCAPHFHLTRGPGRLLKRTTGAIALRLVVEAA
jgi:GcrA cell cycle regulator